MRRSQTFAARPAVLAAPLAVVAALAVSAPAAAKDPITVVMDHAKVMRITSPADTIIVGNPGIADAALHDRQTLIITGRMVGVTNLVILDAKGQPIADEIIQVEKIQNGLVTVQRNANRYSYNCTPHCNNMIETGDSKEHFDTTMTQLNTRNSLAAQHSGAGTAPQ